MSPTNLRLERTTTADESYLSADVRSLPESSRINTILDCTRAYRKAYDQGHREKSKVWVAERLANVEHALGRVMLPDLTENRIREYMSTRRAEGAGGRTVNMETAMLARAIGKTWKLLWPGVKRNEEPKGTGRALTPAEETRLLSAAADVRSPVLRTFVEALLLTGMRCGELTGMTWRQVDVEQRIMTIGRAKTDAGTGRQIPMNQELFDLMKDHAQWFTKRFGEARQEHYLFPAGERWPSDPTQPTKSFKTAWSNLRIKADVSCRIHDLRHTAITKLAESGASDSTIMAIAGHLSRAMLERYSHIRMKAKRQAVEFLSTRNTEASKKVVFGRETQPADQTASNAPARSARNDATSASVRQPDQTLKSFAKCTQR